jgi:hypothetical protein
MHSQAALTAACGMNALTGWWPPKVSLPRMADSAVIAIKTARTVTSQIAQAFLALRRVILPV